MTNSEFRTVLKTLGWSQRYLSGRLGVTVGTVNKWALGTVDVPHYVGEYLRVMQLAKQIYEGKQ